MATRRKRANGAYRVLAPVALGLLFILAGCAMPDPRVSWATARAALGGGKSTVTPTPSVEPTATVTPTPEQTPLAPAPTEAPTGTPAPTATPRPTATATPTISMLVGPAVPWLTVQAYTSTPRPAYVAATPPEGPAAATIPPRPFPGSPAPTWTPVPTVFPVLPGQPATETPSAPTGPELELLSIAAFVDASTGELVVTGEVRNIGNRTLTGVRAVVNLYDAQDRLLGSASEPLVYPSLAPDQRSPFAVAQPDRPESSRYTVQFLDAEGKIIDTLDSTG